MSHYNLASVPGLVVRIMKAFPVTLEMLLLSLAISLGIGVLIAAQSMSKHKWNQRLAAGYIAFMRGIPTLVLIFLLYLGLPQVLNSFGINTSSWSKMIFIVATLSLTSSANMAEMMRSAYQAVDKGQLEAAYSIGMTKATALRRIVFPQAFGIAIPTLGNNIIMLFKETSLGFTIGIVDILGQAVAISSASFGSNRLETYLASAIIYWGICVILEQGSKAAEKAYTRGRKQATA